MFVSQKLQISGILKLETSCIVRFLYCLHLPTAFFYFSELNKNPVEGFSAGLIDDNDIYRWEVLIIGPPDTL